MLVDPHTATGTAAARALAGDHPVVTMATAHPAKFPDAVERATGVRPALPDHLADLFDRPEHVERLPDDLAVVEDFVARRSPDRVPRSFTGVSAHRSAGLPSLALGRSHAHDGSPDTRIDDAQQPAARRWAAGCWSGC